MSETWVPGDPIYPPETDVVEYRRCTACGTQWSALDVAICPECGYQQGERSGEVEPNMSTYRRSHDPFAPHPRPTAGGGNLDVGDPINEPETGPRTPSGVSSANTDIVTENELESLRRVDLAKIAEQEGIAVYGTRAELLARIRRARQD